MFSQERAITSGEEKLTASIMRSAAKDKFNLLQPALKAFKEKDKDALANFEDAYPKFLKTVLFEKDCQPKITGELIEEPEFKVLLDSSSSDETETNLETQPVDTETQQAITDFFYNSTSLLDKRAGTKNKGKSKGILPTIFDSIENIDKNSVYSALDKAGFIFSGNEFLEGEI